MVTATVWLRSSAPTPTPTSGYSAVAASAPSSGRARSPLRRLMSMCLAASQGRAIARVRTEAARVTPTPTRLAARPALPRGSSLGLSMQASEG
jgi:hypothetical protein